MAHPEPFARPLEDAWRPVLEAVLRRLGAPGLDDVGRLAPRLAELSRAYNEGRAGDAPDRGPTPLEARVAFSFARDVPKGGAAVAELVAAGDPSRLKLLHRLCDGEWCVTELAEAANVGLSTVSQQLRLLRAERIVARRRAGKHIFYSLADAHVIDLIRSVLEHAAEPHVHEKASED